MATAFRRKSPSAATFCRLMPSKALACAMALSTAVRSAAFSACQPVLAWALPLYSLGMVSLKLYVTCVPDHLESVARLLRWGVLVVGKVARSASVTVFARARPASVALSTSGLPPPPASCMAATLLLTTWDEKAGAALPAWSASTLASVGGGRIGHGDHRACGDALCQRQLYLSVGERGAVHGLGLTVDGDGEGAGGHCRRFQRLAVGQHHGGAIGAGLRRHQLGRRLVNHPGIDLKLCRHRCLAGIACCILGHGRELDLAAVFGRQGAVKLCGAV